MEIPSEKCPSWQGGEASGNIGLHLNVWKLSQYNKAVLNKKMGTSFPENLQEP